jgi:protein-L-isoaspartate(D-aspartate) O-methyltransferase
VVTWSPLGLTPIERCERMVEHDIVGRGMRDGRVLAAMRAVPRHRFVPAGMSDSAYDDCPLPIGEGQTISQPYIVALMAEALDLTPTDRVLEIGTGSGYAAAVLGQLAAEVWSVERIDVLAERARHVLRELGCLNVHVVVGDGTLGWPAAAPFDAIVVTAGGPRVPEALLAQLTDGGRLVMPVGGSPLAQTLVRVTHTVDADVEDHLGGVCFVPLLGEQGWPQP